MNDLMKVRLPKFRPSADPIEVIISTEFIEEEEEKRICMKIGAVNVGIFKSL